MDGTLEGGIGGGLFDLMCKQVSRPPRSKMIVFSTPTHRGTGGIEKQYERGERQRFQPLWQPEPEKP